MPMDAFEQARTLVVQTARRLVEGGYLLATGGNVSVRIPGHRAFAITPSDYDYRRMLPEDVCVLDLDLRIVQGARKDRKSVV